MAVKIKSIKTKDVHSKNSVSTVHYIKVNKGNRKGAAEAIGGVLIDHKSHAVGDFHIVLNTRVGVKVTTLNIESGDIVFRTNKNKRWQVGTRASLKKRFPNAKFA